MGVPRKITVDVDDQVLAQAQKITNESISETVRLALKLLSASQSFQRALSLRGQVKFSKSWRDLKDDR